MDITPFPPSVEKTSFSPSVHTEHKTSEYRFTFPGEGLFHCSVTGLAFKTTGEGEVLYRDVQWEERWLQSTGTARTTTGPLFDIKCPQKSICQLYLPHCDITAGLSVAHISDEGIEVLEPQKVTRTHVVVKVTHLSLFGLFYSLFKVKPARAQALLFLNPPGRRRRIMRVFLLPLNVPLEEVMSGLQRHENENEYIASTDDSLILFPNQSYSLQCCPHEVQPEVAMYRGMQYGPNFHPTFEVLLDPNAELVSLTLLGPGNKPVWSTKVTLKGYRPGASSSQPNMPMTSVEKLRSVKTEIDKQPMDPELKGALDNVVDEKVLKDEEMTPGRERELEQEVKEIVRQHDLNLYEQLDLDMKSFTPTERKPDKYSFTFPGEGLFHCSQTQLVFRTTGEGEVFYEYRQWDIDFLEKNKGGNPAGCLFRIVGSEESIRQLYLPHCGISAGNDLSVAHISVGFVNFLKPQKVTPKHVVVDVTGLSKFGVVYRKSDDDSSKPTDSSNETSAQVLLFLRTLSRQRRILLVYLQPSTVLLEQLQKKPELCQDEYISTTSSCDLIPSQRYSLECTKYEVQPAMDEPVTYRLDPNCHSTFEVILDQNAEVVPLTLWGPGKKQVWKRNIMLEACSSSVPETATERGAVAGPSSSRDVTEEMTQAIRFVDQNMDELIKKVTTIKPILDTLLTKGFIKIESYNEVISKTTVQEMTRKLLVLLTTNISKYCFYKCLESNEKHLVDELKEPLG